MRGRRITLGGSPELVIEDRSELPERDYRFRAYLRSRTAGGYLTAFGPTELAAAERLIGVYEREIIAVQVGIAALQELSKRSRA